MDSVILTMGVDLGQKRDPTAIAVLEIEDQSIEHGGDYHFETRFLERLPLGTPYPAVARRLAEVQRNAIQAVDRRAFEREFRGARVSITTYVDATGVGTPVVDLLNEAGIAVRPCYFTYGDRRTDSGIGQISIGKAWLVSRLQALFQSGRMHLPPNHPEAGALTAELLDYEIRVDQNANDRYGAFKTGSHDDLVTALGLAAQVTPYFETAIDEVVDLMNADFA
jgi:hypothetical protein